MNIHDLRSSQSSYGDPRHLSSSTSLEPQPPPTKTLLDGFRDNLDLQNESKRYNPLNHAHPRSSALLNANDPVTMYLLTETAIGDSINYEVLSLEEVEELKKEHTLLSGRMDGTKKKLALEMKLRDAAKSLGRLYNPSSSRTSEEFNAQRSPKSRRSSRRSLFGRNGDTLDKTDEELAVSSRKCEDLAQELWRLERRTQEIQRRLLEHTAGVLQMTHKGLKKNPKGSENGYDYETDGVHEFDDRSLYKPTDHDEFGGYSNGSGHGIGAEHIQNTERKLEALSERMRGMILQQNPNDEFHPVPHPNDGGPMNPTATVDAHLHYIENGLGMLNMNNMSTGTRAVEPAGDIDLGVAQNLGELSARLHSIVDQSGLSRGPMVPPPPGSGVGLQEQLSYLENGMSGLESRVEGLLEQKSILTIQIQQQRELNSKSDAQRDAHIADLVEQLHHARKQLELSEREVQSSRDELSLVMEQLNAVRDDLANNQETTTRAIGNDDPEALAQEKAARARAEADVSRLEDAMKHLRAEMDGHAEAHEGRSRAEAEIARLEAVIKQHQDEAAGHAEVREAHSKAEEEISRLQAHLEETRNSSNNNTDEEIARLQNVIEQLHSDADARAEEMAEARDRTDQQVSQLEETIQQIRNEADAQVKEAVDVRTHAQSEVARLEAAFEQLRGDVEPQIKEATDARAQAEDNAARLQAELTEMEGELVRVSTELTMAKAELDGAYGSRSQRAAAGTAIQEQLDALNTRNLELTEELANLKSKKPVNTDLQNRAQMLEKELRETIDDYESMTKSSIEFEREREHFEGIIDGLRDRCEKLEIHLNEERINWMGISSPTSVGRDSTLETTSTMVLKNEFKKMMRDTRTENMKILKAEHEERRRLENLIRTMKREQANAENNKSNPSQTVTAL